MYAWMAIWALAARFSRLVAKRRFSRVIELAVIWVHLRPSADCDVGVSTLLLNLWIRLLVLIPDH